MAIPRGDFPKWLLCGSIINQAVAGPQACWKGATPFPRTAQEQETLGQQGLDEGSSLSAPHRGGGRLARIWRKSAHPYWSGREKRDSEGFYHE